MYPVPGNRASCFYNRAMKWLRSAIARLIPDIVLDLLGKLGIRKFRYRMRKDSGNSRPVATDFSLAVPFSYPVTPQINRRPIGIVCHLFHADLAEWMLSALGGIDLSADVYISTDTPKKADFIRGVFSRWEKGSVAVRVVENRGRDIAPKLITFADVYAQHDLVLLLHSKKSPHYDFGEAWRDYLVQSLAGSSAIVNSVLAIFDTCPSVGMVIPQHYSGLRAVSRLDWGWNFRKARRLASRMNIDISADGYIDMPSGSMLWARPQALKPFLNLHLSFDDFPAEPLPDDGTLAHCIERLFLFACEKAGYTWLKVSLEPAATSVRIEQAVDIERFVAQHRFDLLRPSTIP